MGYSLFPVFLFLSLFGLQSAEEQRRFHPNCPGFSCGKLGELNFPFTNTTLPSHCGLLVVDRCDNDTQTIQLDPKGGRWYNVTNISQANEISIRDELLSEHLYSQKCKSLKDFELPKYSYISFSIKSNITVFDCPHKVSDPSLFEHRCNDSAIYYSRNQQNLPSLPRDCSQIHLPLNPTGNYSDIFTMLTANFSVDVKVTGQCWGCHYSDGDCKENNGNFYCANAKGGIERDNSLGWKLGVGLGGGIGVLVVILLIFFLIRRHNSSNFLSSDRFSKSEIEVGGDAYFGIPVFSYSDLEKATNNFDSEKELGDGGYGTVYYGKLKDGREVAVKRLYEHNCKRLEQFLNEIQILTRLRHKHLVSLYGCTSRRSRELLLVYEYIPNGTVADHLHGDRAHPAPLPWPARLAIAVQTAEALAYLHASDIIHRDVKTHNILLDHNFNVKVADFGLSRLFPNDVSHVSTAPQGTPGYVDPEYHKCFQLTDKSDVYSFGVVLIELVSSLPAVDICRNRDEINLAYLAISKVQKGKFDELVDPCFWGDGVVRGMAIGVAELAFRCLQPDKEMRPGMDEVLEELKVIWHGEVGPESRGVGPPPRSPNDCVEASLLKNVGLPPCSPDTVTAKWSSGSSSTTTPSFSC